MIYVDGHVHFLDPNELDMPQLPPEAAVLNRAYLPGDIHGEFVKAGISHGVLVQCYPQTLETNRWLFRQANSTDCIAGVVAWVDLQKPDAIGHTLDNLQKEPKFVGIRHISEDEPDIDWIVQKNVLKSLEELARRDIPYDMNVKPQHLKNVLKVAKEVPTLRMIIDHIAKPNIAKGSFTEWAEDMGTIAENQQVYCKLSGMITEADWKSWTASDIAPYVLHVTSVFGWDRVVFGSDWPVCLLAGNYQKVWKLVNDILSEITNEQKAKVFGDNAKRFYGLKIEP